MTKGDVIRLLDKEIEFAKGVNIPQFVLGLQQAKEVLLVEFSKAEEMNG